MGKTVNLSSQLKVHTPNLLKEIGNNQGAGALRIPLNVFGRLLFAVGERAAQLNDPELNALMCRLTIYDIADPHSPDFDLKRVKQILSKASIGL